MKKYDQVGLLLRDQPESCETVGGTKKVDMSEDVIEESYFINDN